MLNGHGQKLKRKAFSEAKALLQSSTILVHYDPSKLLILSVDASPYGLGAVLSHQMEDGYDKPVSLASRSLSQAEKNYSQIEKEALAIIFVVRKFHQYLHVRHFHIQSDHKQLQYLFHHCKQVPAMASARIQRWALMLGAYDYSIAHKPGKAIAHADGLSRLPLPDTPDITPIPAEVAHLIHKLSTSIVTAETICKWTDNDPVLSRVRRLVLHGWTISHPDPQLLPFHSRWRELSVVDGCNLWGSRVIVPSVGQNLVLEQLHDCHPGISRMKSPARCYVWWPKIDSNIEDLVSTCQLQRSAPPKALLHPWEYPQRPWSRIHIDHAGPFLGHLFLIIVDAYSK